MFNSQSEMSLAKEDKGEVMLNISIMKDSKGSSIKKSPKKEIGAFGIVNTHSSVDEFDPDVQFLTKVV